jgi:PAS domain S-box-containing protein
MFLAIAFIPLFLISDIMFNNYKDALEANRLKQLENLARYKADKIETFFANLNIYFGLSQVEYVVKKNLPVLSRLAHDPGNSEFIAAKRRLDGVYGKLPSNLGFFDIMLTNSEGKVVYSSNPEHFSKEFLKFLPDPQQKAFNEGKNKIYFSDIFFTKADRPRMLATEPALDFDGNFIGVIAADVNLSTIYTMIQDVTGLGETGETLIGKKIGDQAVFLNPLRHDPRAALKKRITIGEPTGCGLQRAVKRQKGVGQFFDYRGKKVVGAWQYIPSLDWGVVAKIDTEEAFVDIENLKKLVLMLLVITSVSAGIMAFSIARSVAEPIKKLSKAAQIIGSGNLDYKVATNTKDELGQLSTVFDKMVQDLKSLGFSCDTERQRLYNVLEALPVYVVLLSEDYHVPFANKFFRERFGESHGKRCYEYLFNRIEACENCETYKVMKTNALHHWEWLGPDNRNYDIYDYPFVDTDGSRMILKMGIDITERRQAELAVHKERQRLFEVLETLPAMICLFTPDYKVAFANRAFRDKFGESGGRRCYEYCFGGTQPCEFCEAFKVLETGKPQHWEKALPGGAGVIDAYDFPFTDVDGSHLILEMALDITEQKRTQEKLRQSYQYTRSLIEASLDPLVTISAEGKITDVNEATIKATGLSRQELVGTEFFRYFTEPEKAREGYRQVFAKGQVTDYPLALCHKSGSITEVLYNATLYRNKDGEIQGVFAAARDVTERNEIARRTNATNALLTIFSKKSSRKDYLDALIGLIQSWSGCQNIGIRIVNDKGYIPYESYTGFSREFWKSESRLSLEHSQCVCPRIIAGNPDPRDASMMTPGGSFHCDDTDAFVARLSPEEKTRFRNVCIQIGFLSLSVIPIRYREKVLGTIHLADKEKKKIPLALVEFLESIALLTGEAINRFNLEDKLRESESRLRFLSSQLLSLQEDERKRISAELHDDIAAKLAAIKFSLEKRVLQTGKTNDEVNQPLKDIISMVLDTIVSTRRIMVNLRPAMIDDLGILATLNWYCREFEQIFDTIHLEKQVNIEETEIPDHLKIVIFRIVQEAMNNIAKHSGASNISLVLEKTNDFLMLSIEDNGQGFDVENKTVKAAEMIQRFGMVNMEERARFSGGDFSIKSLKGKGTLLKVTWPLKPMKMPYHLRIEPS